MEYLSIITFLDGLYRYEISMINRKYGKDLNVDMNGVDSVRRKANNIRAKYRRRYKKALTVYGNAIGIKYSCECEAELMKLYCNRITDYGILLSNLRIEYKEEFDNYLSEYVKITRLGNKRITLGTALMIVTDALECPGQTALALQ